MGANGYGHMAKPVDSCSKQKEKNKMEVDGFRVPRAGIGRVFLLWEMVKFHGNI